MNDERRRTTGVPFLSSETFFVMDYDTFCGVLGPRASPSGGEGQRPALSGVAHSLRSNRASDGRQDPEPHTPHTAGWTTRATYLFPCDEVESIEEAELLASDGANNIRFGCSVAIDGDVGAAGALSPSQRPHVSPCAR